MVADCGALVSIRCTVNAPTGPGTGREDHPPAIGDSCRTPDGSCDGSCNSHVACYACGGTGRGSTDAERVNEVAEDLRAKGYDLTDAEVDAKLIEASRAL